MLARADSQLVSIVVEGKVSEPFGQTVYDWRKDFTEGKQKRLAFLRKALQLEGKDIDQIRYQLLHRTASALIEAERFNAPNALVLVHSFSQADEWLDDYERFLRLFDLQGGPDSLAGPKRIGGMDLYFGWARGDRRYRER